MKRAGRLDHPHRAIVDALRTVGCSVLSLASVGSGCPDLLICKGGCFWLLEVKSARGRLTEAQTRFHGQFPVQIVKSVSDALAVVGVVTR